MAIKDQTHNPSSATEEGAPTDKSSDVQRIVYLVIGDTIVFLVFAIVGILSHGKPLSPLNLVQDTVPFMLGWFLIAPYIGAFSRKKTEKPGKMAFYTILAWLPSLMLGVTFRGIAVDHQVPPLSFMIVTLITNAIFLTIWRVPFAWLTSRDRA